MKRVLPFWGKPTVVSPHFPFSLITQHRKGKRHVQTELFLWETSCFFFFFLRRNERYFASPKTQDLILRGLEVVAATDWERDGARAAMLGYLFPAMSRFCHVCNSLSSTNECMDKSLSWLWGGETEWVWMFLCKL